MRLLTAALVVLTLTFATGCGSKSSSSGNASSSANGGAAVQSTTPVKKVHFAKTKFLLHAGLAFGAFHRYLYKPFKAGAFSHPLQHKLALVKAAAAALFVVHEVKKASEAAQGSALLRKLFSPLSALAATLTGLAAGLKGGHADASMFGSASSAIDSIKSGASSAGAPVVEHAPPTNP
jgi:hypothetical protein